MFRLTLKNLAGNRVRLALTAFAVTLAVSFVVASFVLTDGLRSSFGDLSEEIVSETDYSVRPGGNQSGDSVIDRQLLDQVKAVEGVEVAAATFSSQNVFPIPPSGEPISSNGPPQLSFNWIDDERLSTVRLVEGESPDEAAEFTIDIDAAAKHEFVVGDTYTLITPDGQEQATLTGLTSFGEDNATLGATLLQFELDYLMEISGFDHFDTVDVIVADDADAESVAAALGALDPEIEVVDQATLESEQKEEFNSEIGIVNNVLLGFAGVSLFVSIFIIYNTFSIVLGQRTKELALLRTIGADPRQLQRSVMGEALAVGIVSSALGIGAGILVALGLKEVFNAIGATLPDSPVIVAPRTIIAAAVVGIGATLFSAMGPARAASKVPPIAALRDGVQASDSPRFVRLAAGSALAIAGIVAGGLGLFWASTTSTVLTLMAVGAMGIFIGVTLLSPLLAEPLTRLCGWPLEKLFSMSGHLAKNNAGRNPRRTATTAAALMIGLALVSTVFTVGQSMKAQLRNTLEESVTADYLITNDLTFNGFTEEMNDELNALSITESVARYRYESARVNLRGAGPDEESSVDYVATNFADSATIVKPAIVEGEIPTDFVNHDVLVSESFATDNGFAVGDSVRLTQFDDENEVTTTIVGIYTPDAANDSSIMMDISTSDALGGEGIDWFAVALVEGTTPEEAETALAPVGANYPQANIATASDFVQRLEGFVDQVLTAVNVMVALAVIIALIGIANTLALSVFERTRELGLLRAVGMTRRQLRRMIRLEAALVALFGAVLGVVLGLGFGWALVEAMPDSITSTLAIPVGRILLLVAVSALAGLVAAWGPARRAGRLNVLDAISH